MLKEITDAQELFIVFIDELHTIVGAERPRADDAGNMLAGALARGELRVAARRR